MMRLFALAVSTVIFTTPASAQTLTSDARVEALAGMVVHEEACALPVDEAAVEAYVANTFDDAAEALSALRTNIGYYRNTEGRLDGLDRTVRCAALRQFASSENLLVQ